MFYDWEKLSKVVRQDMTQQGYKVGTAQQCKKTLYTLAMFQVWEHPSNLLRQGIRQECFKIGNRSAM